MLVEQLPLLDFNNLHVMNDVTTAAPYKHILQYQLLPHRQTQLVMNYKGFPTRSWTNLHDLIIKNRNSFLFVLAITQNWLLIGCWVGYCWEGWKGGGNFVRGIHLYFSQNSTVKNLLYLTANTAKANIYHLCIGLRVANYSRLVFVTIVTMCRIVIKKKM